MRRSLFFPPAQRNVEATPEQLVATGSTGGWGVDPIDGDAGYVRVGGGPREIPLWTLEKARAYSIAAYRSNPMGRAIVDTYTSFAVGDAGVSLQCSNPQVRAAADGFWNDPKNVLGARQEPLLRDHMLMGETALEMLVGQISGVTRYSLIDPSRIVDVELLGGNPLWPFALHIRSFDGDPKPVTIADVDDFTGLRTGECLYWASWKALITDRRGSPFLSPVLDDLDDYDMVLSNLIDRTALARYMVWDVEVQGTDTDVKNFIKNRGGTHIPRSGSIEVHNQSVKWQPQSVQVGTFEDTATAAAIMTRMAGGAGLAKTWLAEPDGANRATSLSMAEPVRRRVGGVQNVWLAYQTELVRFAIDQAVRARRLEPEAESVDAAGNKIMIPAAQTVNVVGPEIAAADAEINANILTALSQGLKELVITQLLTPEAAKVAAKKAWELFVGIPYIPELDKTDGSTTDDLAQVIADAEKTGATAITARL